MTDKDRIFVVQSNDNKYMYQDRDGYLGRSIYRYYDQKSAEYAIERAEHENMCHVVELVEAPAKVVVSEEEAKMLKKAKSGREWAAGLISKYATELFMNDKTNNVVALEDRLMRAYVNGWTVEKPKRYVLPMPYGADDDDPDQSHYAVVNREYHAGPAWHQGPCVSFKKAREHYTVTQADIDAAPDWVKAITPVEVTDDEQ